MNKSRLICYASAALYNCTKAHHLRISLLMVVGTLMLVNGCTMSTVEIPDVNRWQIPNSLPKVAQLPTDKVAVERRLRSYTVHGKRYWVKAVPLGYSETGLASWYGGKFHGRLTANQEVFDMYKPSAAHKTLPLPSYIRVLNHNNNKSVIVRVNDRGPFVEGRIVDLSYAAAKLIGMEKSGLAPVTIEVIKLPDNPGYNTYQAFTSKVPFLKEHRLTSSLSQAVGRTENIHPVNAIPFDIPDQLGMVDRRFAKQGFEHHQTFYR